jgi:predicted TIM-barrel fold metal-dependent hydrolase
MRDGLFICDAQVHSPHVADPAGHVNGIDAEPLIAEMDSAGVDRAVIVPLATKQVEANTEPSLEVVGRYPERFRVMGLIDVADRPKTTDRLSLWRDDPAVLGVRVSCVREPFRSMLVDQELDWLWYAASENDCAVMLYAPDLAAEVERTASRFPSLRIVVDHLGLRPRHVFEDIAETVAEITPLGKYPNVAVKATSLPTSVPGPYPFRGAHEGLRLALDAFGPERVFWGSDLTRLPCTYAESVTMFTEELPFLTRSDLDLIMGKGLCAWLGWPAESTS